MVVTESLPDKTETRPVETDIIFAEKASARVRQVENVLEAKGKKRVDTHRLNKSTHIEQAARTHTHD